MTFNSHTHLKNANQCIPFRYDEVVGTLDFARELTGQFTKLASDDAKDRKKQAKREQQEKARQELAKV